MNGHGYQGRPHAGSVGKGIASAIALMVFYFGVIFMGALMARATVEIVQWVWAL